MLTVLLAQPQSAGRYLMAQFLTDAGFETVSAQEEQQIPALLLQNTNIAACIIDDSFDQLLQNQALEHAAAKNNVALIVLHEKNAQVPSFADACLQKPFSLAQLKQLLGDLLRSRPAPPVSKPLACEPQLDRRRLLAVIDGQSIPLTQKEFDLMSLLYEQRGKLFSREELIASLWSDGYCGDSRTVDSHIARLRGKLGSWGGQHLRTVYGAGYKID